MKEKSRTKAECNEEIPSLKQAIQDLEQSESERKYLEETLQESANLYRSIFDHMLSGVAYCEMHFDDSNRPCDFTYLQVNSAFETQTGLRDVSGRKVTEIIPGIRESDPALFEICGRVSKTGHPERCEIFVKSLQTWFLVSVYSPKCGYVVSIFDVITDRKQMEEVLRKTHDEMELHIADRTKELKQLNEELQAEIAERKHIEVDLRESDKIIKRLAQENDLIAEIGRIIGSTLDIEEIFELFAGKVKEAIAFDRIAIYTVNMKDYTRTMRYVNGERFSRVHTGEVLSLADTLTKQIVDTKASLLINSENRRDLIKKYPRIRALKGGALSTMMIPLISKNEVIGTLVIHSAIRDAYSKQDLHFAERVGAQIAGAIANAELFLERKQMMENLMESEEQYRSLASTVDALIVVDRKYRILFANENYLAMRGLIRESVVGKKYDELHGEEESAIFSEIVRRVFETGNSYQDEKFGETNRYWFLRTFNPVKNTDGSVRAITVAAKDITKRKQYEEELREYTEKLEELVRERTAELEMNKNDLEEMNIALKVLLQKREEDKRSVEERMTLNITRLVQPYLEKMQHDSPSKRHQHLLDIIKTHLNELLSPLLTTMQQYNLTPREIQIGTLVQNGKTTKEIAEILGLEASSINTHRNNIRKKLGLSREVNLQSKLRTLK